VTPRRHQRVTREQIAELAKVVRDLRREGRRVATEEE
jgi:hypothetical protein